MLAEPVAEPLVPEPLVEPEAEPLPLPVVLPLAPVGAEEPPAALLLLRALSRSALEPAPALSRSHAVRPRARTAAASAAVRVLNVTRSSP